MNLQTIFIIYLNMFGRFIKLSSQQLILKNSGVK